MTTAIEIVGADSWCRCVDESLNPVLHALRQRLRSNSAHLRLSRGRDALAARARNDDVHGCGRGVCHAATFSDRPCCTRAYAAWLWMLSSFTASTVNPERRESALSATAAVRTMSSTKTGLS